MTFYALVALVGAAKATINTYLSPAVAVLAGVLLLGESLTAGPVAGLLLVLAGAWLATGGRPPGRTLRADAEPVPAASAVSLRERLDGLAA